LKQARPPTPTRRERAHREQRVTAEVAVLQGDGDDVLQPSRPDIRRAGAACGRGDAMTARGLAACRQRGVIGAVIGASDASRTRTSA